MRKYTKLLFGVCVALCLAVSVLFLEKDKQVALAFLDIGQGDAIFIESPSGVQILIDGGKDKTVLKALAKVMPFSDRFIDVVIMTHPDQDHVGGLPYIAERFAIGRIFEPGVDSENLAFQKLIEIANEKSIPIQKAIRGDVIDLGDGVKLYVLFPDRDPARLETNTASIVALLIYGNTKVLLTGDAPSSIEDYLLIIDRELLDIDILKVGHHGSKTSTSEMFVKGITPEYAVISAGKDNSYGHPHEVVLQNLQSASTTILRTDISGSIYFYWHADKQKLEPMPEFSFLERLFR